MVYSTEWMSHINAIGEDSYGNSCWYGMCMGTLFPLFSHKIGSLKFSSHTCPIVKNLVKLGPTPFPHTHVTFPYHSHLWVRYGPNSPIPFPYFCFGTGYIILTYAWLFLTELSVWWTASHWEKFGQDQIHYRTVSNHQFQPHP